MKIYLIRHGETDWNLRGMFYGWTDCDINETGIAQAEHLRDFFNTIKYDGIYASDLLRAVHTAEIITENRTLEIQKNPCFRELFFGDWEDKEGTYIREHHGDELKRWMQEWQTSALPGGEAFEEFYKRVTEGLLEVIAENKGRDIVIVSHNGPMSAMLCYLTGAGPDSFWRFFSEQGCYSSVLISEEKITIEKINCPVSL